MRFGSRTLYGSLAVGLFGATFLVAAAPAGANPRPDVVFVNAHKSQAGSAGHFEGECEHAQFGAIQDGIEAVANGGTVVVCPGTYPGMVTVDKRITLAGLRGATIDATGDVYGIGVSASWSNVVGFKVEKASPLDPDNGKLADGIVTVGVGATGPVAANHVNILFNEVTGNLGSGIDINSSSHSAALFNNAHANGVGINLADDLGLPANDNIVAFNTTDKNFGGCGIALADHSGAGVNGNLIEFNTSDNNGLATATAPDASAGSGIILASPIPGGVVKGNSITFNEFSGNGHGGVVVHAHAPGADFSGNSVMYNRIGRNNVRTDENDLETTGVYLGSASPLSIRVAGNTIGPDYYGIFTSGPVTVRGTNSYVQVKHELGTSPTF
jgi:nitrous oxidase accessory protein NosD